MLGEACQFSMIMENDFGSAYQTWISPCGDAAIRPTSLLTT